MHASGSGSVGCVGANTEYTSRSTTRLERHEGGVCTVGAMTSMVSQTARKRSQQPGPCVKRPSRWCPASWRYLCVRKSRCTTHLHTYSWTQGTVYPSTINIARHDGMLCFLPRITARELARAPLRGMEMRDKNELVPSWSAKTWL